VRFRLTYQDKGVEHSSIYNHADLIDWLESWPDYAQPVEIKLERVDG